MTTEVPVRDESDVVMARKAARELALEEQLSRTATDSLLIAVSEVARNIVMHADAGEILFSVAEGGPGRRIVVVARDSGPGIPDIAAALRGGYSTGGGLGFGLSGAQRLMDGLEIQSTAGRGTCVTMWKLVRNS